MLSKLLLLLLVLLLITKFSVRGALRLRLREWGRKIDRVVNATLIAIAVVYVGQLLFMWLGAR